MMMPSSGSITSQAPISWPSFETDLSQGAASIAAPAQPGTATPMASPPAAVRPALRKYRRVMSILPISASSTLHQCRGAVDRGAQARIGAAAADAGQFGIDLGIRRLGMVLQKRDGRHDLAGLAIPAL